jgi:DNA-binding NarL/FixJ family response regulator
VNSARIPIFDDHAVVRGGFRHFFGATPDVEAAGEAGTGAEALESVRTQDWHLVLFDIAFPRYQGHGGAGAD